MRRPSILSDLARLGRRRRSGRCALERRLRSIVTVRAGDAAAFEIKPDIPVERGRGADVRKSEYRGHGPRVLVIGHEILGVRKGDLKRGTALRRAIDILDRPTAYGLARRIRLSAQIIIRARRIALTLAAAPGTHRRGFA